MACGWLVLIVFLVHLSPPVLSAISTTTSVPPLQWLNITRLLNGPAAPPLKGSSIGYDDATRTLLIFGGESEGGFPQSKTYLLNLDSLIWTVPVPPNGLDSAPPARTMANGGSDMAASDRHGHVVIGGKGVDGEALDDVWEYDYFGQFWSHVNLSPGGPSSRWGASGGIDPQIPFTLIGLNNSFYIAGGFDGTNSYPLSDVWRLNISGTLSPNLPNEVYGSWESMSVGGALPAKIEQGGAIVNEQIVAVGGCNTTESPDNSCAQGDSYVINAANGHSIAPAPCVVPRVEAAVAPNLSGASPSFSSQVFVLLGTYNKSLWQDDNGLARGEVGILDIAGGAWTRVIPAGDPQSESPYPLPRNGAAVLSSSSALIGTSRSRAADTIVFGGQDADGTYLSEMWILRAYNGAVTPSSGHWSGYGNGKLASGADADGSGVAVTFLNECAKSSAPEGGSSETSSSSTSAAPPNETAPPGSSLSTHPYDTQFTHKLLAPLSLVVLLPAILVYRISSSISSPGTSENRAGFIVSALAAVISYGIGIGGFATSFTSVSQSPSSSLLKRSPNSSHLKTSHGKSGLVLFVILYFLLPAVLLSKTLFNYCTHPVQHQQAESSDDEEEKDHRAKSPAPSPLSPPTPGTPPGHIRTHSHMTLWPGFRARDDWPSSDSVRDSSGSSIGPSRSFEVTNRPQRKRRPSGNSFSVYSEAAGSQRSAVSRNLGDINWLDRRRSLNAVGELDYALSQLNTEQNSTTPTTAADPTTNLIRAPAHDPLPKYPSTSQSLLHILFHATLLGLCILSLVELWARAPVATFVVFLIWTVGFYIALFILAWKGRPKKSLAAIAFSRLRTNPPQTEGTATPSPSRPMSSVMPDSAVLTEPRSPYLHHQPPFRATYTPGLDDDPQSPRPVESPEDFDDDEDEDTRQRRMEDEMNRRDVSIVTVPRRKLYLTNPS